jgi:hypothetical protein
VDARLSVYKKLPNFKAANAELARSAAVQEEIWEQAIAGCKEVNSPAVTSLMLSSLNEMIDISTTRTQASRMHPPGIVFVMLVVLVLSSSLLAGYSMSAGKVPSRLHIVGFAVIMSIAVYVILDIEFPRVGLVRIESADQILVDLRNGMK